MFLHIQKSMNVYKFSFCIINFFLFYYIMYNLRSFYKCIVPYSVTIAILPTFIFYCSILARASSYHNPVLLLIQKWKINIIQCVHTHIEAAGYPCLRIKNVAFMSVYTGTWFSSDRVAQFHGERLNNERNKNLEQLKKCALLYKTNEISRKNKIALFEWFYCVVGGWGLRESEHFCGHLCVYMGFHRNLSCPLIFILHWPFFIFY